MARRYGGPSPTRLVCTPVEHIAPANRSGREQVTEGHQAGDGDRGDGHHMRAPGDNKKIQAGDDEIRAFTGACRAHAQRT